ncbi:M50 family metallopeptidase [Frankia sp. AgB1.9]|nr:M50 family metallopeptidase [Frankia sp. AgW1.1]MBL7548041.1 M50 family metallopeptidase [Frankia sp. AgB1.9]MBL7624117.1 M50 family metallopeptidase [Frankia sp. AgB1.8]
MAVMTGLLALWAVTAGWWGRHLDTALHEGGHALLTWAHGGRVKKVHIDRRDGGLTRFELGSMGRFGVFMIFFAGYVSPPLAGLTSASLLAAGNETSVFILAVLALVALLLVDVNRFGIVVLLSSAAVLVGLERYAPGWFGRWCAFFLTWFLLLSGVRSVVVLRRVRRSGPSDSDADILAEITHVPGFLWVFVFGAVSVFCLLKGARLLVAPG